MNVDVWGFHVQKIAEETEFDTIQFSQKMGERFEDRFIWTELFAAITIGVWVYDASVATNH